MAVVDTVRELSYDLLGVITDVEQFGGFDEVCLNTIKRVYTTLAEMEFEPDIFWDEDGIHPSIESFVQNKYDEGWSDGDVMPIHTGKRFPKIDVRLIVRPDGVVDYEAYHG